MDGRAPRHGQGQQGKADLVASASVRRSAAAVAAANAMDPARDGGEDLSRRKDLDD